MNRKKNAENLVSKTSVADVLSKSMRSGAKWSDKDEFLDVIYWMRQVLGLIMGLTWGIVSMKGIFGILLFFVITTVLVYMYANSYQQVDEEEFGGVSEILKEGLMTSFATFLISWIILYSALYFD